MSQEQKTVEFYNDELTAVKVEDGTIYVPLRPIAERLGLNWSGQRQRVQRHAVLNDVALSVVVTHSDISADDTQPKSRRPKNSSMLAIPLDYLNGWLFGINAARVNDDIRPNLLKYQRDCYKVLADAFGRNEVTARPSAIDTSNDPAAVAYRNAMALANLARQQYEYGQRLEATEARIDAIEAKLNNPAHQITDAQAAQISQAVKAVAMQLGKRSGGNEYGGVYGELYRRFEVTSYKAIPANKFANALQFLTGWHQQLTDDSGAEF